MSQIGAGWHPDPWTPGQYRYWTGSTWTADVFPAGVVGSSAAPAAWSRPADAPAQPPTDPSALPPVPPQWGAPQPAATTGFAARPLSAPPRPAPTNQRSRLVLFMALMLLAGLVTGFLGVFSAQQLLDRRSSPSPPRATAAAPSTPPGSTAAPSAPPADPAAAVLPDLVVRQRDVEPTVTVAQLRNGAAVTGATTLDLCNGTYPSESLRTARLQVVAYEDQGGSQLSTEAVAYQSAAATTKAFAELRAVAASCPAAPVTSPVGESTVTTKFSRAPDSAWPLAAGVDRQSYEFTSTDETTVSSHSIAVYLKRGRILLAVYFPEPDGAQSPVAGQSTVAGIVAVFQNRLARLPGSVTGN